MALEKLSNNTTPLVYNNGNGGHEPSIITRANAVRRGTTVYRTGLITPDKVDVFAAPTIADVTTGGSLVFNTNYKFAYAGGDSYFLGVMSSISNVTTANDASSTHVIRATIPQTVGATYYDLFMSVDTSPKWVARITEAQRATGCTITAVATVNATTAGAGLVDIRIPGTGIGSASSPFVAAATGTSNGIYAFSLIDDIDCSGYSFLDLFLHITCDDFRNGAPAFIFPVFAFESGAEDYFHLQNLTYTLTDYTTKLTTVTAAGYDRMKILFGSYTPTAPNLSLDIYYDLY